MAHVDDWGSTPPDERKRLEQTCVDPACFHVRYAHGTIWSAPSNITKVTYTEGSCSVRPCACVEFRAVPPITEDDVIDAMEAMQGDVTLMSLGLEVLAQCGAYVVQHEGEKKKRSGYCRKDRNHEGAHEPVWSEDIG